MANAKKAKPQRKMRAMSLEDIELTQDVKRANQRLRELEKQGLTNSPAYRAMERIALKESSASYKGAKAMARTKKGEIKLDTNVRAMNYNQRQHLRKVTKDFLSAQTSTKKGIKALFDANRDAYAKTSKQKLSNDEELKEFLEIWAAGIVKAWAGVYGSTYTRQVIDECKALGLSKEETEQFLTDHFGQVVAQIDDAIDELRMEKGVDPWEWNDIFKQDEDE